MVYIVSKKYNKKLNSKANSKKGEVHKTDIIKRYQSTEQVKTTAIFTSYRHFLKEELSIEVDISHEIYICSKGKLI